MEPTTTRRPTGRDLAAERVRAGLHQRDIAARMGVSRERVAQVEWAHRPTADVVRRYMAAVAEADGVPPRGLGRRAAADGRP
jgi:transcriptional regulator with XRE-family HTH domain